MQQSKGQLRAKEKHETNIKHKEHDKATRIIYTIKLQFVQSRSPLCDEGKIRVFAHILSTINIY